MEKGTDNDVFVMFQTTFVIFQHLLYHGASNHIAPIAPRKHAQHPVNLNLYMDS